jgi:hypothetical protein
MLRANVTIALLIFTISGFAQSFNINLSPIHQNKLSKIESGHNRIKKFYKYYTKDSAKHLKQLNKKERRSWDSLMRVSRKQDKLAKKFSGKKFIPESQSQDSINSLLRNWTAILNDTTKNDSLRGIASENIKNLTLVSIRKNPNFTILEQQYSDYPDSLNWQELAQKIPGIDSIKVVFKNPQELLDYSSKITEKQLAEKTGAGYLADNVNKFAELNGDLMQYKNSFDLNQNKDNLIQTGKDKVAEKALDYFAENPKELEAASQKASKLLSKYRLFSNSNDLSDAKKQTSMEGKTLFERLVIGGTFNVISTKPLSLDLSPQIGYKFTSRFFVGAGMNYRITFSDSIKHSWYVSPKNAAFKTFVNYDVLKSWYAYLEGEITGASGNSVEQMEKDKWNANYFIGAGRRFLIHPKLYMTMMALYHLNNQTQNHIYPQRFQVRIGLQTSELAHRKKKINYDPNR